MTFEEDNLQCGSGEGASCLDAKTAEMFKQLHRREDVIYCHVIWQRRRQLSLLRQQVEDSGTTMTKTYFVQRLILVTGVRLELYYIASSCGHAPQLVTKPNRFAAHTLF